MSVRARRRPAEEVKLMGDEAVRVLVQRPTVVKKMIAKKAAAK